MPSELDALLRELHERRPLDGEPLEIPQPTPELEAELLGMWSGCFEDRDPADGEGGLLALVQGLAWFAASARLALVAGVAVLAVFAACVVPTSYAVDLGLSVELTVEGEHAELPAKAMAEFLTEASGAERVDMMVHEVRTERGGVEASSTRLAVRLWGEDLPYGVLEEELRAEFPELLADVEVIERPLEGAVETVWARRLAHRTFHLALSEADVEAAREELLVRLYAQGFDEDEVVVKVRDRPDGHREIQIGIERNDIDVEGADAGRAEGNIEEELDELKWLIDPEQPPLPVLDGSERRFEVRKQPHGD
ncbi:hypothetical protein PPSIR1_16470 [Plesiocystis pacifica SIR-1]|uniref:Uncharacterized protein n=1 Tax=Plesiocystis pacifica SIR-1 TaxID=391625 RepID=A6G349_9BACT|nr:hypothetical protein [Plesiocystis pacifica]EDM79674.1 hypothetical protein PPSIR1_16470 [Plesiocystis pacifica SIR-1]